MLGSNILRNPKSSAADVAAATRIAAAVGHTRPVSAWLYARLVGLTLAPFVPVHVPGTLFLLHVSCFPTRIWRDNFGDEKATT